MKVAIVLNTSWNVYNFRMGLIKALQEKEHQVIVIAPEDKYSPRLVEAGCEYHRLKMDSRGANPIKDSALIVELWSIYRRVKPDIILHYTIKPNIYGTIAASLLRLPVINNVCGLGTVFLKKNLVSRIASVLYKIAFRFPRKVFFQNIDDQQLFAKLKLVKNSITDVLPGSGINLSRFQPAAFKRNKKFTFLLISRLIYDKGIVEYIDAIRQLKAEGIEASFQVLGAKDPEHKRGIQTTIIDEWIENNIIDYLGTTDDVVPYINRADCIVLPSYREGTPRTLLEAASSAKPIVATNVPGCNSVVQHGYNGLLCNLKDASDLAAKMRSMYQLPDEQLKTYGINGRQKVEQEYDEKLVIDKYLQSIDELVG